MGGGESGDIKKARAVKRIPIEQRWGEDCVRWVRKVPWNKYKDDAEADADCPPTIPPPANASVTPQLLHPNSQNVDRIHPLPNAPFAPHLPHPNSQNVATIPPPPNA